MRPYRKHHHSYWMSSDERPRGRDRHFCERKVREDSKREIRQELRSMEMAPHEIREDLMLEESDEAVYCHMYGPCVKCR